MLSLQSTQQFLRVLGAHLLSLCMGNRSDYLLMQLGIRVEGLLLLASYIIFRSLSRRPRIISREPRSTRNTTSTSTTDFRSFRWENKCCSLRRHFTWMGLGSFGLGFFEPFRVLEHVGKTAYRLDLRGNSKIFTVSSMFPSFASTPLEAHLQPHPSQSTLKVKKTSR